MLAYHSQNRRGSCCWLASHPTVELFLNSIKVLKALCSRLTSTSLDVVLAGLGWIQKLQQGSHRSKVTLKTKTEN